MIRWRDAERGDVPEMVALMFEGSLDAPRDLAPYFAAFDAMAYEYGNAMVVGENGNRIVALYQLAFLTGLSMQGGRRAQVETLRMTANLRSDGLHLALLRDAEMRASYAGCVSLQLITDQTRAEPPQFYTSAGFGASHIGYKKRLE